jgi:subtilase family serine protease
MRRIARPGLESLETRALLSAVDTILPAVASVIAAQGWHDSGATSPSLTNPNPIATALTPAQIQKAYGFDSSPTAGQGMTIAIVDAYNAPNIQGDLAYFSSFYGLPQASLTVVNQRGQKTGLPSTNAGWALEISLDVEWAHAIAPAANLLLVEASSASVSDLMAAVQTASKSANVVSMSWGGGEWSGQRTYDSATYFAKSNVTYVAASGDDGGAYGAEWPASSPYVLGVGGTTLSVSSTGDYQGETAWNGSYSPGYGYSGSTGGVSAYERLPSFQSTSLGSRYATGRVVPDVSIDGNPSSGVSVYDTTAGLGQTGWFQVGGTSAGAPMWAGLVATADQARKAAGLGTLSSSQTLGLLYSLYGTTASKASTYATDFHDVTVGSNYAGSATTGYDKVTGLGSPVASAIVGAAASYGATKAATASAPAVRELIVVRFLVRHHTETDTTPDPSNVSSVVVATVTVVATANSTFGQTNVAALTGPSDSAGVPAASTTVIAAASGLSGRVLPNQTLVGPTRSRAIPAPGAQEFAVVNIESVPSTVAPSDTPTVPVRGDFLSPPRLQPSSPVEIWDEALTRLGDDLDVSPAEPAPFEPWTAFEDSEEDLSEAAPTLLGAAGLAAVFWLSWNRREAGDDDRRRRSSFIPTPSEN